MLGREGGFESSKHVFGDSPLGRPLLGEAENVLLVFGVSLALLETGEVPNLLVGQPGPPTEGLVVIPSDVARGEVGHLEVRELPELRGELAPDGLGH